MSCRNDENDLNDNSLDGREFSKPTCNGNQKSMIKIAYIQNFLPFLGSFPKIPLPA